MSQQTQPSNYIGEVTRDDEDRRRKMFPGVQPPRIRRDEFIEEYFEYSPGEHVTFVAPTQTGKTTLAFELLGREATKEHPATVLVMKPRDKVVRQYVDRYKKQHQWKEVKHWPPMVRTKRPGWVLWPKHAFDPDKDNPELRRQFRKAILDTYKRGNGIVFGDELYGLINELDLDDELIAMWSRGGGMGASLWGASQKPTHVPLWAYNQAEHLFLGYDPDKRSRIRFGEIGGIDGRFVEHYVSQLEAHSWLYLRRTGRIAAIILPE